MAAATAAMESNAMAGASGANSSAEPRSFERKITQSLAEALVDERRAVGTELLSADPSLSQQMINAIVAMQPSPRIHVCAGIRPRMSGPRAVH